MEDPQPRQHRHPGGLQAAGVRREACRLLAQEQCGAGSRRACVDRSGCSAWAGAGRGDTRLRSEARELAPVALGHVYSMAWHGLDGTCGARVEDQPAHCMLSQC